MLEFPSFLQELIVIKHNCVFFPQIAPKAEIKIHLDKIMRIAYNDYTSLNGGIVCNEKI
jgi:hypothetical protein